MSANTNELRRLIKDVRWSDESGSSIDIIMSPGFDGSPRERTGISVTREKKFGSKVFAPATVNWAGCGSQDQACALDYARALTFAVQVAQEMDAGAYMDPESCAGCGCKPGEGVTAGCDNEDGCGHARAHQAAFDANKDAKGSVRS